MKSPQDLVLLLKSAFALVACAQLVACAPLEANKPHAGNPAPAQSLGTGDGGGGNAIDGKMLESYIVNPMDLPGVRAHLGPIIHNFAGGKKDPSGEKNLTFKTWYLVPMDLKPVSKNAIGVEFMEGTTQQVAIQTENEIWINERLFNSMSEKERARLVLHELMMSFYLYKFMTYSELCHQFERIDPSSCKTAGAIPMSQLDILFPPEPKRSLNADDYAAIRLATRWLMDNGEKTPEKEIQKKLLSFGFDKRFSTDLVEEDAGKLLYAPTERLKIALRTAELSRSLPTECRAPKLNAKFPCVVQFSWKPVATDPTPTEELVIRITDTRTGETIESEGLKFQGKEIPLVAMPIPDSKTLWQTSAKSDYLAQPHNEGKRGFDIILHFSEEGLTFAGFTLIPMIGAGEEQTESTTTIDGKPVKMICTSRSIVRYNGDTPIEDAITVVSNIAAEKLLTAYALLTNFNYRTADPASCTQVP